MEERKPEKPTIPLIPRSSVDCNHDASAVLREVFHDVLEHPVLPENVVENWNLYKIDNDQDKKTAFTMHTINEKLKLDIEAIQIVEKKLAYCVETNLEKEKQENDDAIQKEFNRYKKELIFPRIDPDDVKEYGLITGEDLKPSRVMQQLDFLYDPKAKRVDLDIVPIKLPKIASSTKSIKSTQSTQSIKPTKSIRKPIKVPAKLPSNEVLTTPQELMAWKNLCLRKTEDSTEKIRYTKYPRMEAKNFRLDKDAVIFNDYKPNVLYKKRFKLQNISSSVQRISLQDIKPNEHDCFRVEMQFDPETLKLCAGFSVSFVVYFKAESCMDIYDTYEVNGHTVKLACSRSPPNLIAILIRNIWPAKPIVHPTFDILRAQALNNTIECGACFVGEHLQSYLIFKNNGGHATFFIMTEMQWWTQNVDTLHHNLELDFGDFSITPNYFELDKDEFIVAKVDFYGASNGTCIENLNLICNNITWETIDMIADVIVFDKYTVVCSPNTNLSSIGFQHMIRIEHECSDGLNDWDESPSSDEDDLQVIPSPGAAHPPQPPREMSSSADIIDEVILDYLLSIDKDQSMVCDVETTTSEETLILANAVVYFGKTFGHKMYTHVMTITNQTMINLKYRWELHALEKGNYKHVDIKDFAFEGITFGNVNDYYLPAYGCVNCEITLHPKIKIENFFGLALGLIIEGIPLCAVRCPEDDKTFKILPHRTQQLPAEQAEDLTPVVDVQIGLYDVICLAQNVRIIITPRNIFGSHNYIYGSCVRREFKLIVYCNDLNMLSGVWVSNEYSRVKIQPEIFDIVPKMPKMFDATLEIDTYNSEIVENICVLIADFYSRTIDLTIKIEPPHLRFVTRSIEFGLLFPGNAYQRRVLILNRNSVNVDWEIREQYQKQLDRGETNKVMVTARNLSCGDVEITYKISPEEDILWKSTVFLYTIHNSIRSQDAELHIEYQIAKQPVRAYTDFSECPILSPPEVLYVGHPKTFTVYFANTAMFRAHLKFGEVHGYHAKHFDIAIAPSNFVIGRQAIQQMSVCITPKKYGIYDEIYLTFNLLDRTNLRIGTFNPPPPIIITVMLAVDDVFVKVILPQIQRDSTCSRPLKNVDLEVLWPPKDSDTESDNVFGISSSEVSASPYTSSYEPEDTLLSSNFLSDITDRNDQHLSGLHRSMYQPESESVLLNITERRSALESGGEEESNESANMDTLPMDLIEYLKTLEGAQSPREMTPRSLEEKSRDTTSSFSSDTTITESSCYKFDADGFKDVSRYKMDVCGVPIRTVHKCGIKFENMTPCHGTINVEISNFKVNKYQTKKIDLVLQKLKYSTVEDEWEKRLGPHGIAIDYDFLLGTNDLLPKSTNEIVLSIYANTWGVYKEDLIIDINKIYPLRISVIIEVVGLPLEFPIGVNNIHKTTILRFGILPYQSKFEIRHLQVRNISMIPVNVIWHIIMRHTNEEMAQQPITILFDVSHANDDDLHDEEMSSQGNLVILHGKCVGKSEHRIFKLQPKEMYIQPKQTMAIKLGVNTRAFAASYNRTEIEAYLIGYLYLPPNLKSSPLLYRRPVSHHNEPVKAKLTATLELPVLKLDMSAEDLHIALYADQVIDAGCTRHVKHLHFKNHHAVEADVKFKMDLPFVIESCRVHSDVNILPTFADAAPVYAAVVKQFESAQVAVSYEIDRSTVWKIANTLFDCSDSEDDYVFYDCLNLTQLTFNLVKYLRIDQKGFVRQNIPITLTLYFPVLEVAEFVDFGDVYIGNVAKELCVIKNFSGCRVEFTAQDSESFHAASKTGVIKPGRPNNPLIYDLYIVFIPQDLTKFQEEIILTTQIPGLKFTITVTGIGRKNERYYKPNLC